MTRAVERRPDADLLYSDEDTLLPDGRRADAYFKPDFSPACCCRRTSSATSAWTRPPSCETWVASELAWRAPDRVVHVQGILSHGRATPQSASSPWPQDAHEAGSPAIAGHLLRNGRRARIHLVLYSVYLVRETPPEPAPSVTVVLRTHTASTTGTVTVIPRFGSGLHLRAHGRTRPGSLREAGRVRLPSSWGALHRGVCLPGGRARDPCP
jgi:hypothetical protein